MEQFNRVQLRGVVGNSRVQPIGDTFVARFNLATNYVFKSKDGELSIETTWHQVCAFAATKGMPAFDRIRKGVTLSVEGRLRNVRFTDPEGQVRSAVEVLASKITVEKEPKEEEKR